MQSILAVASLATIASFATAESDGPSIHRNAPLTAVADIGAPPKPLPRPATNASNLTFEECMKLPAVVARYVAYENAKTLWNLRRISSLGKLYGVRACEAAEEAFEDAAEASGGDQAQDFEAAAKATFERASECRQTLDALYSEECATGPEDAECLKAAMSRNEVDYLDDQNLRFREDIRIRRAQAKNRPVCGEAGQHSDTESGNIDYRSGGRDLATQGASLPAGGGPINSGFHNVLSIASVENGRSDILDRQTAKASAALRQASLEGLASPLQVAGAGPAAAASSPMPHETVGTPPTDSRISPDEQSIPRAAQAPAAAATCDRELLAQTAARKEQADQDLFSAIHDYWMAKGACDNGGKGCATLPALCSSVSSKKAALSNLQVARASQEAACGFKVPASNCSDGLMWDSQRCFDYSATMLGGSGSCVNPATRVSFNPPSFTIQFGRTATLCATVIPADKQPTVKFGGDADRASAAVADKKTGVKGCAGVSLTIQSLIGVCETRGDVVAVLDGKVIQQANGTITNVPSNCVPAVVPPAPKGESVDKNIEEARKHPLEGEWFKNKVRNGHDWDYKQVDRAYSNFGNFDYGATGRAAGFPSNFLLRMAGWAQRRAGTAKADCSLLTSPYCDDPHDQEMIQRGIDYFDSRDKR